MPLTNYDLSVVISNYVQTLISAYLQISKSLTFPPQKTIPKQQ